MKKKKEDEVKGTVLLWDAAIFWLLVSRQCPMGAIFGDIQVAWKLGGDGRIRTADLLIKSQLLYQLSYKSE